LKSLEYSGIITSAFFPNYLKRLACGKEYFEPAKRTIEIDHHSVNAMFGDLNYNFSIF